MTKEKKDTIFRMVAFGAVILAMLVYLISGALKPPTTPETYGNSYSTSPGGHSALAELLGNNGFEVTPSITALPEINDPDSRLWNYDTIALLEPDLRISEEFYHEFEVLMDRARTDEDCEILLALPKRGYSLKELEDKTIILEETIHSLGRADSLFQKTPLARYAMLRRDGEDQTLEHLDPRLDIDARTKVSFPRQYFELLVDAGDPVFENHLEVLISNEDGNPVALRYHPDGAGISGGLIVLADPDILTNRYISKDGAADLSLFLFRELDEGGKVFIDESGHGYAADASIEYLALTAPGLWVTLSVILVLLVWAWRESTVLRPTSAVQRSRGQRKFAIEALGRMMLRARDHAAALIQFRRRSKLVLTGDRTSVRRAGIDGGSAVDGDTSQISRHSVGDPEQAIMLAANRISQQLRTGERDPGEVKDQS
ncbi:DUF4350 domain-containing protein [Planctomycetota bacterium]|nr:DUF4350 domain-containing protein [Planctomycetota bacterium]